MAVSDQSAARTQAWPRLAAGIASRLRGSPAAILLLALADWVWSARLGIAFTDWWRIADVIVLMAAVAWFYTVLRARPALAEAVGYAALWIAFSAAGACFTYLAATPALPLRDDLFAAADAALGFDWLAWAHMMQSRAWLHGLGMLIYGSLAVQITLSILVLAFARVRGRNEELLRCAIVALVLTGAAFALLPSLGPIPHYHDAAKGAEIAYLPPLLSLRAHGADAYSMLAMQGIIPFPSYHVVLAILLTHAQRGGRWTFVPFLLANAAMLATIPAEGGHYLIDMLAGAAIALLSIAIVGRRTRVLARTCAATA